MEKSGDFKNYTIWHISYLHYDLWGYWELFWKNDVLASNQCAISKVHYSGDLRCALLKLTTKAKAGNHMVHVIG